MNALGNLGNFISKGVYSVSGTFHPFGGAVDVIVVEQPDGSFKSSPWYVRFGKFQGVLKAKEKIVKICVNGAEANFYMHLNNKGQAYFLKELEKEEEADKGDESEDSCGSPLGSQPVKSRNYNCVATDSPHETMVPRTNSDQVETMGFQRLNSLECAEIVAQLLDVNWSTPTKRSSRKEGPFGRADRDATTENDILVDNVDEDVIRCRIADGFLDDECEVISKMGEDCNCNLETRKSMTPALSRSNNISQNCTRSRSLNVGLELSVESEDHDETDVDKKSGANGRESLEDKLLHIRDNDESRRISGPINGDRNENGDVRDPSHRLSHSLDTSPKSRPPLIFSRSYGGREGQLLRSHGREGFGSSKIVPAETIENISGKANGMKTEHGAELKRTMTDHLNKVLTPTSELLASLNLNRGGNAITFTFCTKMLGKQQVDARIYLWKWSDRIIISDVDGTITKSDILGQCMPLVGMDWTQEGVAGLYSAIKENGYQLMFLSARSISQAYITRQFLLNLKQDGKALPDGPVVISPDGLFPSLYREVIRRVPHEFKIACLEDIKALFPLDSNPFYAGFGNRDTDEISYLKVGIPKGKIFIINPKEDYNSWNYWKLPPSAIDV